MFRLVVLFAALATINAQYYNAPTLTSQQSNTYRTLGNLGQVSTFSKSIDTPFSSVSKSDVRVSNPGIYSGYGAHYGAVAPAYAPALAPALATGYHGYSGYGPALGRPLVAKPVVAAGPLLGVAYSAAPTVAHMTYSNGLGINYAW